jgi:hypothetical protein
MLIEKFTKKISAMLCCFTFQRRTVDHLHERLINKPPRWHGSKVRSESNTNMSILYHLQQPILCSIFCEDASAGGE